MTKYLLLVLLIALVMLSIGIKKQNKVILRLSMVISGLLIIFVGWLLFVLIPAM